MVETVTSAVRRLPKLFSDALLAVAFTVVGWVGMVARPAFQGGGGPPGPQSGSTVMPGTPTNPFGSFEQATPAAYVLTAAGFLPLALRRRFPLGVLVVTSVVAALYEWGHFPPNLVFLAPLVALYTVATLRSRRTIVAAGIVSAGVQLGSAWATVGSTGFWTELVRVVALLAMAGALGDATRNRRAYVAEVEQRAVDAERNRDDEARRRVDEERLRIARELHDITAHSLSVIAVQSGGASHVIDSDPGEARKALEAIRQTSKGALDELRSMLGVLRGDGDDDAPLAPAPGLARLSELIAPLLQGGYDVTTDIDSDLGEIPAVVEGSAYRIIQEGLTNVLRHAGGGCRVWVRISRQDGTLALSVDDDGASPPQPLPADGHGLAGMRERATALGGTFEAGPRPGEGGFHVGATLPIARSV